MLHVHVVYDTYILFLIPQKTSAPDTSFPSSIHTSRLHLPSQDGALPQINVFSFSGSVKEKGYSNRQ